MISFLTQVIVVKTRCMRLGGNQLSGRVRLRNLDFLQRVLRFRLRHSVR